MHQICEDDPQSMTAGLYIDIEPDRIYALGIGIDREEFERAARVAIQASEDEGEPITLWPGQEAAIAEIGGSVEHIRWLRSRTLECLAGELVVDRLLASPAVASLAADHFDLEDEEPDITFAIRASLRINLSEKPSQGEDNPIEEKSDAL